MNLNETREEMRNVGARIVDLSARLSQAAMAENLDENAVQGLQNDLHAAQVRYNALQAAIQSQQAPAAPASPAGTPQDRERSEILASREYARAFANAIRNGLTPRNSRGMDETRVLFDALTIGGGDPVGTDGGFLVPEDVDTMIHEQLRQLNPLSELFSVEPVTSNSGWRPADNAPTSGFAEVDEMAAVPTNQQPSFRKIAYTLTKYGLIIPVSNELAADETAGLFAYLARWFAKKLAITENLKLLTALATLDADADSIAANAIVKGVKRLLNVKLDPAIAAGACLVTNQDGFNALDAMEDQTGRPLLQQNPADATPRLFGRHPIYVVGNSFLASANSAAPIYVGDAKQFATLFRRNPMEIVSTNIGGTAFSTDSTQVRGIVRMDVQKFDTAAMTAGKIALA